MGRNLSRFLRRRLAFLVFSTSFSFIALCACTGDEKRKKSGGIPKVAEKNLAKPEKKPETPKKAAVKDLEKEAKISSKQLEEINARIKRDRPYWIRFWRFRPHGFGLGLIVKCDSKVEKAFPSYGKWLAPNVVSGKFPETSKVEVRFLNIGPPTRWVAPEPLIFIVEVEAFRSYYEVISLKPHKNQTIRLSGPPGSTWKVKIYSENK